MASKLDKHKEEIMELLNRGATKTYVASHFSVNRATLYWWLQNQKKDNRPAEKPVEELKKEADRIVLDLRNSFRNEAYRLFAREMEDLENSGLWLGNGHHAAQRMTAKLMELVLPVLEPIIRREVMR